MISINPVNGKQYQIPTGNDQKAIDQFLAQNKNKAIVVVQGLGFVGAVMSLICANALTKEYAVIGVDILDEKNYWKIASINEGVFPIVASDPKIDDYFEKSKSKNNFYATYDSYAYSVADVIVVDINLDVAKKSDFFKKLISYDVDLLNFKKAIEDIGKKCKEDVLVLVETTVPPGTCSKIVAPLIRECFSRRGLSNDKFKLGHSYERVMPGPDYIDSIQNFYRVYSGINDESANEVEKFLKTIISTKEFPLTRLGNTNATEMAKVLENSYRAMNVAFMVEWSRFAEIADVNIYEVVRAIKMRPTHTSLMFPGIGVGGYCLPKDPLMASWAKKNLFQDNDPLGQSEKSVQINDQMPLFAFNFLKEKFEGSLKNKKVLLLGVSYRGDVADTRYSPVEPFYEYLLEQSATVILHDPYVEFWEEKSVSISSDIDIELQKEIDIIVFCANHSDYKNNKNLIEIILKKNKLFILDPIGILSEDEIDLLKKKHIVKVVGRGDI
jgi:nucleotide sugar dehydrogenase